MLTCTYSTGDGKAAIISVPLKLGPKLFHTLNKYLMSVSYSILTSSYDYEPFYLEMKPIEDDFSKNS